MSEEQQVVAVRRRRSQAEGEQLVAEYEASRLSRREFCRQHGIAVGTLDRYRRRRQAGGEASGRGRWVAVELSGANPAASSGLTVVLSIGRKIEVGRGFDANTLQQLVRLLEPI